MSRLRYLTAGESHGTQLTGIVEGCPAGLELGVETIDKQLGRRQHGYGRGGRMAIERDRVIVSGGVRYGRTTGAPIALTIMNRDAANWRSVLAVNEPSEAERAEPVTVPRPGHADLGGALLYGHNDIRDVIERASARETAMRVACGAVARGLLEAVGCRVFSHVVALGGVVSDAPFSADDWERVDADPVRCASVTASAAMQKAIDAAAAAGDTLGGVIEVIVDGYPRGVGSYVHGDRRLTSLVAAEVMSVPAIKGVEFGLGFEVAHRPGSRVHDPLGYSGGHYIQASNNSGGIEGGMSTGAPIVLRAAMKPIATLGSPLASVELGTHKPIDSRFERSDVCAVPAAGVVLEAVVALCLADALLDRFGGVTIDDVLSAIAAYGARTAER